MRRAGIWVAILILALLLPGSAAQANPSLAPAETAEYQVYLPLVPKALGLPLEISVQQAYQMYLASAFFLDVRTQEEWDDYHIPGSTLIPLDELEGRTDEVPDTGAIVVVCRSGNRSQTGRDILLQAGFEAATSMAGGVSAWREVGYPIE